MHSLAQAEPSHAAGTAPCCVQSPGWTECTSSSTSLPPQPPGPELGAGAHGLVRTRPISTSQMSQKPHPFLEAKTLSHTPDLSSFSSTPQVGLLPPHLGASVQAALPWPSQSTLPSCAFVVLAGAQGSNWHHSWDLDRSWQAMLLFPEPSQPCWSSAPHDHPGVRVHGAAPWLVRHQTREC